jgi:hypothetical protein
VVHKVDANQTATKNNNQSVSEIEGGRISIKPMSSDDGN